MDQLWLKFTDPSGSTKRIPVESDRFTIGRQSDCDLAISDGRLSRSHAVIERRGGRYEIVDIGSSNGTDLNGAPVFDPEVLSNGDAISLGGFKLAVEITEQVIASIVEPSKDVIVESSPAPKAKAATAATGSQIPTALLVAAPLLAIILVAVGGIVAYFVISSRGPEIVVNNDIDDLDIIENKGNKVDGPGNNASTPLPGNSLPNSTSTPTGPTPPPSNLSETAKVEASSVEFLRGIAQNDPKAFITAEQAKKVGARVKQLSGSSAVAENIKSAAKNGSQLKTIADSKNLKPELLAVAAIARLGNSRGDVVQTANSMAEVLGKLSVHIGTEFAEDCLLLIAAYDQGQAGETMKMRNMLQDLATKSSESSRTIRTIWYLQKEGKITQADYDRALTFLAVGTIAQNPKEFGVNAEALKI